MVWWRWPGDLPLECEHAWRRVRVHAGMRTVRTYAYHTYLCVPYVPVRVCGHEGMRTMDAVPWRRNVRICAGAARRSKLDRVNKVHIRSCSCVVPCCSDLDLVNPWCIFC
jgi:hypothetical protein